MARMLPREILSAFDEKTLLLGETLARSGVVVIGEDLPQRFAVAWVDVDEVGATQLEQTPGSHALRALCTCRRAADLRHRCEHVAAALYVTADGGTQFRVPASARPLVPKCGPEQDRQSAAVLLAKMEVQGACAEACEVALERAAASAGVAVGASARPAARSSGSSESAGGRVMSPPRRPAESDPQDRMDRHWRSRIEDLGTGLRASAPRGRQTRLVYRIHTASDSSSWFTVAVELLPESDPGDFGARAPRGGPSAKDSGPARLPPNGIDRARAASGADIHSNGSHANGSGSNVPDAPAAGGPDAGPRLLYPGVSRFNPSRGSIARLHPADRELVLMILGASRGGRYDPGVYAVDEEAIGPVVRALIQSGRCVIADPNVWNAKFGGLEHPARVKSAGDPVAPATWDDRGPWSVRLELRRLPADPDGPQARPPAAVLHAALVRGSEVCPVDDVLLVERDVIVRRQGAALLEPGQDLSWLDLVRRPLEVPLRSVPSLLEHLAIRPELPRIDVDPALASECGIEVVHAVDRIGHGTANGTPNGTVDGAGWTARPHLLLSPLGSNPKLRAMATIRSGPVAFPVGSPAGCAIDPGTRRIVVRDHAADARAVEDLRGAGLEQTSGLPYGEFRLAPKSMWRVVGHLSERGWLVESDGNLLRAPRSLRSAVRWNVDWFDLEGDVDFGDATVPLAQLFEAIRERRGVITLADGSLGVIPQEWMKRFGLLAHTARPGGKTSEPGVRFDPTALLLLEAALCEETVDRDEATRRIRTGLRNFAGIAPLDPEPSFQGELRHYQREGLGWMAFLREFGLGGCLADDMGLGKTVQVLAMLDARRAARSGRKKGRPTGPRTSLVVAPRSLIFNWLSEAQRFTPQLRLLDASGLRGALDPASLGQHDVVVTTYGILRRDIATWRSLEFDYAILDEAQAIKNAQSQTAAAARLLKARHRLAMSGTPVENHLGELWSLVQFLNPALLGEATSGDGHRSSAASRLRSGELTDPEVAAQAAKAVRPFILRRTKAQVAPQLPDRIEKSVVCQLEAGQRKIYDRLRREVRASVLGKIEEVGMKRAGIYVLEALLRLRQAACHPGLLDSSRAREPSAKLDALIPTLQELAEEGHKTLVFSQFTSLLDLVEPRLKEVGLRWVRLDGSTRDRNRVVEEFQGDPQCPVFLVSLKAGGLGLNLTAADHVVLLDPWWNPAVEAQAIDRAHRIGQHRTVIATRLIAADTVEERIVELQARKRALADAVMGGAQGPLAGLTREDLESLLS